MNIGRRIYHLMSTPNS